MALAVSSVWLFPFCGTLMGRKLLRINEISTAIDRLAEAKRCSFAAGLDIREILGN